MNQVTQLVDHAATRDDRWLMLALLVLFVLTVALAFRWLSAHVEKMETRHVAERDAILATYRAERQERFAAMTTQADKLGEIIQENTTAIASNTELIRDLHTRRP